MRPFVLVIVQMKHTPDPPRSWLTLIYTDIFFNIVTYASYHGKHCLNFRWIPNTGTIKSGWHLRKLVAQSLNEGVKPGENCTLNRALESWNALRGRKGLREDMWANYFGGAAVAWNTERVTIMLQVPENNDFVAYRLRLLAHEFWLAECEGDVTIPNHMLQ